MTIPDDGSSVATNFKQMIFGIPGINITGLCRNINELHQKLRSPWKLFDLAILFAGSHSDLGAFVSFQDLLEGFPLLLVLPERSDAVCLKGHQLHPRYISYVDSDFSDVVAVLRKMVDRQDEVHMAEETGNGGIQRRSRLCTKTSPKMNGVEINKYVTEKNRGML